MRKKPRKPSPLIMDLLFRASEQQEHFILLSENYNVATFASDAMFKMFSNFFNRSQPNMDTIEELNKFYQIAGFLMFLFATRKADKDIDTIIEAVMNDQTLFDWVAKQQIAMETLINADDVIEMLENTLAARNATTIAKQAIDNFNLN